VTGLRGAGSGLARASAAFEAFPASPLGGGAGGFAADAATLGFAFAVGAALPAAVFAPPPGLVAGAFAAAAGLRAAGAVLAAAAFADPALPGGGAFFAGFAAALPAVAFAALRRAAATCFGCAAGLRGLRATLPVPGRLLDALGRAGAFISADVSSGAARILLVPAQFRPGQPRRRDLVGRAPARRATSWRGPYGGAGDRVPVQPTSITLKQYHFWGPVSSADGVGSAVS
jgi:hypothetical protein